jgi:hypothetical protein
MAQTTPGKLACPSCLDFAILRKDGTPIGNRWVTMQELMEQYEPCRFCAAGEKEQKRWTEWREAMEAA